MSERLKPWSPTTEVTNKIKIDDLEIHFKRTIRVPDSFARNDLPPDGGNFQLYKVDDYADKLPLKMVQKGGLFFPMYRKEVLWIGFKSSFRYAIKVSLGGVNAISGEPVVPTAATTLRTRKLIKQGKPIQDYVVTGPEGLDSEGQRWEGQRWLDGIAVAPGKIRQFVVMPFEITRLDPKEPHANDEDLITFEVTDNTQVVKFSASAKASIEGVKTHIAVQLGIRMEEHRLLLDGGLLDYGTLASKGVTNGSILEVHREWRGGGGPPPDPDPEMNISAGGIITQGIVQLPRRAYRKTVPVTLNVQVLNSVYFRYVTGKTPPRPAMTAKDYVDAGYPFFSMEEEPTTVSGDFQGLQSIAQIEEVNEESMPVDMLVTKVGPGPVGVLNPHGSEQGLELEWELKERLGEMGSLF